jgi:hypothetical protein
MGVLCSYALLFLMFLSMPDERKPQDAHESMAVANLRLIGAAETAYASKGRGYADIPSLIAADLLDSRFAAPISCYELKVTASENDYNATAIPISSDAGRFAYYNSPDGIVRYSKTMSLAPAGYAGKPVE